MSESVMVTKGPNHVAEVMLNRPDHLNALDSPMADALHQTLVELDADPQVRVVLLKGAGKAFCVGIDVNELPGKSALEYREWIERMERPLAAISRMRTPVIAQVHGVAAANGMGLVAAADLVIAADNARMGLTAINVGLNRRTGHPGGPLCRAQESARVAALRQPDSGRGSPRVGPGQSRGAPRCAGRRGAPMGGGSGAKKPGSGPNRQERLYTSEDMDYAQQFAFMNEAFARLCTTDDAKEGVRAFFEKRPPVWHER